MAEKKRYLLRVDQEVYAALEAWAADDLRSVNAQIEFLLRRALEERGRLKDGTRPPPDSAEKKPRSDG